MQAASKGAHRRVEWQDSGLGTVQEHDEAASYVGYTASPRPTRDAEGKSFFQKARERARRATLKRTSSERNPLTAMGQDDQEKFDPSAMKPDTLTPDMVSSVLSAETLMGALPNEVDFLKSGTVHKLSQGDQWKELRLVCTESRLLLTAVGCEKVKDCIPLSEVLRVRRSDNDFKFEELSLQKMAAPQDAMPGSSLTNSASFFIEVLTASDGYNGGRPYIFRTSGSNEGVAWLEAIGRAAKTARKRALAAAKTPLQRMQMRCLQFYESSAVQVTVAIMIMGNFIVNTVQAEIMPEGADEGDSLIARVFVMIDAFFSLAFGIELLINLAANWMWNFLLSGWCLFDATVVIVSLISFFFPLLPGVKSLRCFPLSLLFQHVGTTLALTMPVCPVHPSNVCIPASVCTSSRSPPPLSLSLSVCLSVCLCLSLSLSLCSTSLTTPRDKPQRSPGLDTPVCGRQTPE